MDERSFERTMEGLVAAARPMVRISARLVMGKLVAEGFDRQTALTAVAVAMADEARAMQAELEREVGLAAAPAEGRG